MLLNETINSILARRSFKAFKSDAIPDDVLETIIEAGKYAPTGMNRQPWHFTVIKSDEGKQLFKEAIDGLMAEMAKKGPGGPPPAGAPAPGAAPAPNPNIAAKPEGEFRGAPVLIIVSVEEGLFTAFSDGILAMGNMMNAAASFGVMSGWTHMVVKDLITTPEAKAKFGIPENYEVCAAAFFGYGEGEPKDRGPRREGTVTFK